MELKHVEEFRKLIIEPGLPGQMDVLFGIGCPVCGKNDRICLLKPPGETAGNDDGVRYAWLWSLAGGDRVRLAVCKFCGYLVSINESTKRAELIL